MAGPSGSAKNAKAKLDFVSEYNLLADKLEEINESQAALEAQLRVVLAHLVKHFGPHVANAMAGDVVDVPSKEESEAILKEVSDAQATQLERDTDMDDAEGSTAGASKPQAESDGASGKQPQTSGGQPGAQTGGGSMGTASVVHQPTPAPPMAPPAAPPAAPPTAPPAASGLNAAAQSFTPRPRETKSCSAYVLFDDCKNPRCQYVHKLTPSMRNFKKFKDMRTAGNLPARTVAEYNELERLDKQQRDEAGLRLAGGNPQTVLRKGT